VLQHNSTLRFGTDAPLRLNATSKHIKDLHCVTGISSNKQPALNSRLYTKMSMSALCILDIQGGVLPRLGDALSSYLISLESTIAAAREAHILIIHVSTSFRHQHPEIHPSSQFAYIKGSDSFITGSADAVIPQQLVQPDDIVVIKKRVSAFSGSDLELLLRSLKVEKLVLAGVATSGAVLSTLRQAADLDFKVTVLKDLCMDGDAEVQRVLMEKVFVRQAEVVDSGQWFKGLGK